MSASLFAVVAVAVLVFIVLSQAGTRTEMVVAAVVLGVIALATAMVVARRRPGSR